MPKSFLVRFGEIVQEEGFASITDFVNNWISKGENFRTLHQWLLLKGCEINKYTVWLNLRDYLTIPYGKEDVFRYKWDAIAKTKKFDSLENMMEVYRKTKTNSEMAAELGIDIRTVENLVNKLDDEAGIVRSNRHLKHKDSDGFTKIDAKERWIKIVEAHGYKTLREAVLDMQSKKMSIPEMAEKLGVSHIALRKRMNTGKIPVPLKARRMGLFD